MRVARGDLDPVGVGADPRRAVALDEGSVGELSSVVAAHAPQRARIVDPADVRSARGELRPPGTAGLGNGDRRGDDLLRGLTPELSMQVIAPAERLARADHAHGAVA